MAESANLSDQMTSTSLQTTEPPTPQIYSLSDLQSNLSPDLWYRLHVFIYDLRNFNTNPAARSRLDSTVAVFYLGEPYFSVEEANLLRNTFVGPDSTTLEQAIQTTLDERLERRKKKLHESGDFRVCAAHDLAPIFEKSLGIDSKKMTKDSHFISLVTLRGLKLKQDENWKGLASKQKGNQGKNRGERKHKRKHS